MKCSDEISIGEYVKTHKGDIHKVTGIREEVKEGKRIYSHKAYYLDSKKGSLTEAFIIKHSKNIIDLIQKDDYVNGKRVIKANCRFTYIDDDSSYGESEIENGLDLGDELIYWSSEIKSIITKEQIKQIEFKIKE